MLANLIRNSILFAPTQASPPGPPLPAGYMWFAWGEGQTWNGSNCMTKWVDRAGSVNTIGNGDVEVSGQNFPTQIVESGKTSPKFNGVTYYGECLLTHFGSYSLSAFTIWVVGYWIDPTACVGDQYIIVQDPADGPGISIFDGKLLMEANVGGAQSYRWASSTGQTPLIPAVMCLDSSLAFALNGTTMDLGTVLHGSPDPRSPNVGCSIAGPGDFRDAFNGVIREVILTTGIVDGPTKAAMCVWASVRHGISKLADSDMESAGVSAWSSDNSTITKQTSSPHSGTQCLRVAAVLMNWAYAYQSILTVGRTYRVLGWVRSDGTNLPSVWLHGTQVFTGTTSTTWQRVDVQGVCTGATGFYLGQYLQSGGYTEYDDFTVVDVT